MHRYAIVARIVRLLVDFKAGLRVGVRSAAAQTQNAASGGAATVGRNLKNVTAQGGALKDFASGGRNFWSHMPKDFAFLESSLHEPDLDSLRAGVQDTPADVLLALLTDMLDGRPPDLRDVALVRTVLLKHLDLYEPLNSGGHIRAADLDADVVQALMLQLGASAAADKAAEPAQGEAASSRDGAGRTTGAGPTFSAGKGEWGEGLEDEDGVASSSLCDVLPLLLAPLPQLSSTRQATDATSGESGSGSCSDSDSVQSCCSVSSVPQPVLDEGHALSVLGFHLLQREGLISQFRMHPTKLARLLRTLESGYTSAPYHNSTHAADVLQTLHVLLRGSGLREHYLDRLGLLAAYFAAIVHDHGHPGLTADFLIATSDPLAVRYNDRSPLENHHGASFFALVRQPDLDVLGQLAPAERVAFRKQVLDLVMATDMKQHFSLLAHFNTAHQLAPYSKEAAGVQGGAARRPRPSRCGGAEMEEDAADAPASSHAPRPKDETERTLSLQIALKCADLGHLGEELEVHSRWIRCLEEEFFLQGDRERQLGLPISPLFDRAKQGVSKSQVGFFDFIALPLVHAMAGAFPGAKPLMDSFVANYEHWRSVERAAVVTAEAGAIQGVLPALDLEHPITTASAT
ncbi:hypothetical protein GPECTOR_13g781 [Gonium pectorale]|uniref:PDEase domain-containing protein n=1 Tax=Gonium pectorale TaxID=33097 RepID=A0A150GNB7_GONPE|nr:hypothetical protein GPECTOR_13g781 [Gonium pectorale]|eukprot:KXZ51294.1 hypothetical protein GPECTOR_13g781 [Gonium pectorale]